jgi:hypothetical protein
VGVPIKKLKQEGKKKKVINVFKLSAENNTASNFEIFIDAIGCSKPFTMY